MGSAHRSYISLLLLSVSVSRRVENSSKLKGKKKKVFGENIASEQSEEEASERLTIKLQFVANPPK